MEKYTKCTLPTKAEEPPSLDTQTATLAGAPPGAFLKAGASASETPATVGTKSINISPKEITSEPLSLEFPFVFDMKSLESPTRIKSQTNKNKTNQSSGQDVMNNEQLGCLSRIF